MKYDVKTVLVAINRPGSSGIFKNDLIFADDSRPLLVIEWSGERGESTPAVAVVLDPRFLKKGALKAEYGVDYSYDRPIDDPRRFQ